MPKEKNEATKKKVVVVEEVVEDVKVEAPKEEVAEVVEKETKKDEIVDQNEEKHEVEVETNEPLEETKTNYLFIIIPTALLVGALVGGLITYFSGISRIRDLEPTPTPSASVEPDTEASPVATSAGTLKREDLKVQVLNGSGVAGAATKAKTYLESLGYKNVIAGNADSSDFAETEISIKDAKKEFVETLVKDLDKNYQVAEDTKTLVTTSKYDIVITLGKK